MRKLTNIEVDLGPRLIMIGTEALGTSDNIFIHVVEATEEELEKLKSAYEIRLVKLKEAICDSSSRRGRRTSC